MKKIITKEMLPTPPRGYYWEITATPNRDELKVTMARDIVAWFYWYRPKLRYEYVPVARRSQREIAIAITRTAESLVRYHTESATSRTKARAKKREKKNSLKAFTGTFS